MDGQKFDADLLPDDLGEARDIEDQLAEDVRMIQAQLDTARQEIKAGRNVNMDWFRSARSACAFKETRLTEVRRHIEHLRGRIAAAKKAHNERLADESRARRAANAQRHLDDLNKAHKAKVGKLHDMVKASRAKAEKLQIAQIQEHAVVKALMRMLIAIAPAIAAKAHAAADEARQIALARWQSEHPRPAPKVGTGDDAKT